MGVKRSAAEDPRLTRVAKICGALPEAERRDQGSHAAFSVRKKVFAYFLNDHHGDGIVSVCARAFPGEAGKLIEAHPKKFYSPAYIGPRGWVGLRLDRGKVDWNEVRDLVTVSYLQAAPKSLRETVEAELKGS
jgi:predicted DNA-binding protein (MmcQ/YjbR family)